MSNLYTKQNEHIKAWLEIHKDHAYEAITPDRIEAECYECYDCSEFITRFKDNSVVIQGEDDD